MVVAQIQLPFLFFKNRRYLLHSFSVASMLFLKYLYLCAAQTKTNAIICLFSRSLNSVADAAITQS
jgi:hypothetical protein